MACVDVKLATILVLVIGICITRQTNDNNIKFAANKLKESIILENRHKLQDYFRRSYDYEEYVEVNCLSFS